MAVMPSGSEPAPGKFARAISAQIRAIMALQQVSGSQLGGSIGRSQSYMSKRLRGEASFSANDVEAISEALGVDLLQLLRAAVFASRRPDAPAVN